MGCIVSLITGPTKSGQIDSILTFSIVDWITHRLPKIKRSPKLESHIKDNFVISNEKQKRNQKHSNIQIIEKLTNVFVTDNRFTIN